MSIDFSELRALLGAIAQTDITELTLKTDSFELAVRQGKTAIAVETIALPTAATVSPNVTQVTEAIAAPVVQPEPVKEAAPPTPAEQKWTAVTSPMVGTFYRAPAPDEPSFVEKGDTIRKGQTVCIIEAMKLMNEIEAEIAGQIMEITVANGEPVEYGQTLMWVKVG